MERITNRSRLTQRTFDEGFSRYLVLPFDEYEMPDGFLIVWNVEVAKRQSAAAGHHLAPIMRPTISGSTNGAIEDIPAKAAGIHGVLTLCLLIYAKKSSERLARHDTTVANLSDFDTEELPRRNEMRVSRRRRYADNLCRVCKRDRADMTVSKKVEKVVWLWLWLSCPSVGVVVYGWACFVGHVVYDTTQDK
jgi:hypothetical protein